MRIRLRKRRGDATLFSAPKIQNASLESVLLQTKDLGVDPRDVDVLVVGGHVGVTILPLLSQESPKDEDSLLKAVQNVHAMIDKEVAGGINVENIFVCGFSQGVKDLEWVGKCTLLYPKTLGGAAVFSGWVPFNTSVLGQIPLDAKKKIWLLPKKKKPEMAMTDAAGPW